MTDYCITDKPLAQSQPAGLPSPEFACRLHQALPHLFAHLLDQSTNQPVDQPIKSIKSNKQPIINQSINQSVRQSVSQYNASIYQSISHLHTHTYTLSADVPVKCKAYRSKTSRHVKTSRGFISHATAKFQMVFIYIALVTGILNTHLRREDQTQGLLSCIHTWSPRQVTTCCFPLRPASHLVVLP